MIPHFDDSIHDNDDNDSNLSANYGRSETYGEESSLRTQEDEDYEDGKLTGWLDQATAKRASSEQLDTTVAAVSPSPGKATASRTNKRPIQEQEEGDDRERAGQRPPKKTKKTPRKTPWGTPKPAVVRVHAMSVEEDGTITKDPRAAKRAAARATKTAAQKQGALNHDSDNSGAEEEKKRKDKRKRNKLNALTANDCLDPDMFVDYDGKVVNVTKFLEDKMWQVQKLLGKRVRGKTVQYLCQWEDTWETRRMYRALKTYQVKGYPVTKLATKIQDYKGVSVKMIKCQWVPGWEPESNVEDSLIDAFRQEQAEKKRRKREAAARLSARRGSETW